MLREDNIMIKVTRVFVDVMEIGFWYVFGLVLFCVGCLCLYKFVSANDQVDFCHIDSTRNSNVHRADEIVYDLHGHVPWRFNRMIATDLPSYREALDVAREYGCEVK